MAHPLVLQLRNLQTLLELGVEKNTAVVFPAPLMSAIGELSAFLAREARESTAGAPHACSDAHLLAFQAFPSVECRPSSRTSSPLPQSPNHWGEMRCSAR
jgi:hypothetical protein